MHLPTEIGLRFIKSSEKLRGYTKGFATLNCQILYPFASEASRPHDVLPVSTKFRLLATALIRRRASGRAGCRAKPLRQPRRPSPGSIPGD